MVFGVRSHLSAQRPHILNNCIIDNKNKISRAKYGIIDSLVDPQPTITFDDTTDLATGWNFPRYMYTLGISDGELI